MMVKRHFKFGLNGLIPEARTKELSAGLTERQKVALNAVLCNIGGTKSIRNLSHVKVQEYGFSQTDFQKVMKMLHEKGIIHWSTYHPEKLSTKKSEMYFIKYIWIMKEVVQVPTNEMIYNIKDKKTKKVLKTGTVKRNTPILKAKHRRIQVYHNYISKQVVRHNVSKLLYNQYVNYLQAKSENPEKFNPPSAPNGKKKFPIAIYSDMGAKKGGRLYNALWIETTKALRQFITINGEKTADIDGCSMHVQLLYRKADLPVPAGNLYIYPKGDDRRKIMKNLMLLMMNTSKKHDTKRFLDDARKAVMNTYRREGKDDNNWSLKPNTDLLPLIIELEEKHRDIFHLLYQSNWGELQRIETEIMLRIMLAAIENDILVLPVHDGCLCQERHKDYILYLFQCEDIIADENTDHYKRLPYEEMKELWDIRKEQIELEEEEADRREMFRRKQQRILARRKEIF